MGERQFPDAIHDADFAAQYGLPADTEIIGPPMSGTLLTKTPSGGGPLLKYDGPWPPPKKEPEKTVAQTRPAAADPAPPELIPDDSKALAVCLSPDVCKSPNNPVPYMSWGKASDNLNYSPDVRSNGMVIKRQDSLFSRCYGDEPGVGLGCKSGTVGDVVKPVTSSGIVRANGIWVQRHNDRCTLNDGNTDGEYVYVQSTEANEAPDGKDKDNRAWYEKAWDWTGDKLHDAGQAIHEFDDSHGRIVTRGMGALQAIGGGAESVAGAGLAGVGGAASATGVGAAPGIPAMIGGAALAVNGYDNFSTGLKQLWTGETQTTAIAQAAGQVTTALGGSPQTAQTVQNIVGITQAVGGGAGTIAAGIGKAGTIAKTAKIGDDVVEEGADAARAIESGEEGARSTRTFKSLRDRYLGRTPGKASRTGREVRERMREEGTLRTNRRGQDEFLAEDGNWYQVDSPQTHMGHYPVDAVDYWNETGRYLGERSSQVREWMLNSNNYRFEYGPLNSARGGATTSRYLPPVN